MTCIEDVQLSTFQLFWDVLRKKHSLRELGGDGLNNVFYCVRPGERLKSRLTRGVDYLTKDELILYANARKDTDYGDIFVLFTEKLKCRRRIEEAKQKARAENVKKNPTKFISFAQPLLRVELDLLKEKERKRKEQQQKKRKRKKTGNKEAA